MPVTLVKSKWVSGDLVFYDKDDNEIFTIDGTNRKLKIPSGSTLDLLAGSKQTRPVVVKTANYTVLASESGTVFIADAADIVFTLPATVAGLIYTFVCAAVSAATGLSISPQAADNINEGTDNKDLINSGATDVLGDSVTIVGDGDKGWFTVTKIGTWAAES